NFDRRAMTQLARRAVTSLGVKKPGWMGEMPAPVRFGVGGALAIVVVVVIAIALRSPVAEDVLLAADTSTTAGSASPKSAAVPHSAATTHSDEPSFKMPDLLGGDDERSGEDARALADRFEREVQSRQLKAAVTSLDYLLKADPKAAENRDIRAEIV